MLDRAEPTWQQQDGKWLTLPPVHLEDSFTLLPGQSSYMASSKERLHGGPHSCCSAADALLQNWSEPGENGALLFPSLPVSLSVCTFCCARPFKCPLKPNRARLPLSNCCVARPKHKGDGRQTVNRSAEALSLSPSFCVSHPLSLFLSVSVSLTLSVSLSTTVTCTYHMHLHSV